MKKRFLRRILSLMLAALLLAGGSVSALAAENPYASGIQAGDSLIATEANGLEIGGNRAVTAGTDKSLVDSMNPTQLVQYYVAVSEKYYRSHYLEDGFRYFNVSKYLHDNPDVSEAARSSGRNQKEYALDDYLHRGILQGKRSGTSFDPAVAILLYPEMAREVLAKKDFTPGDLLTAFEEKTGAPSTEGYTVLYSIGPDGKITLYIADDRRGPAYPADTGTLPAGPEDGQREPVFKNGLASTISPYSLYVAGSSGTESVALGGVFHGENYSLIKDKLTDKYTLMIYISASNQESGSYRRQTVQLMEAVAADSGNLNIIICAGGCDQANPWKNQYFSNITDGRAGIFYLDSTAVSPEIKAEIRKVSDANSYAAQINMAYNALYPSPGDILDMKEILNEKTLVPLVYTDKVDSGDPSLLLGFMDMAADLFPADDYGLVLSNHGGGILSGLCLGADAPDVKSTWITPYELESALGSSKIFKEASDDGKVGFLFLDACLMSCGELAYSLSDYYRYMAASEEVTWAYTDYLKLVESVNRYVGSDSTDDRSMAIEVAEGFQDSSWHTDNYNLGTMAVYDSEYVDDMTSKVNDVFVAVTELIASEEIDDVHRQKNYDAIYRSNISCYLYDGCSNTEILEYLTDDQYATVDIGEILSLLRKNLGALVVDSNPSDADRTNNELLLKALGAIDDAGQSGALIYSSMKTWESIPTIDTSSDTFLKLGTNYTYSDTNRFWYDLRGENTASYGVSLYWPRNLMFVPNVYSQGYGSSALAGYVDFLSTLTEYEKDVQQDRVTRLKSEIAADDRKSIYTDFVSGVSVRTAGENSHYLSIEVSPSYSDGLMYDDSFGSPLADAVATVRDLCLVLMHRAVFGEQEYDMVLTDYCSLNPYTVSVDNNRINIRTDGAQARYTYISGISNAEDTESKQQALIVSDAEDSDSSAKEKKLKLVVAAGAQLSELLTEDSFFTVRGVIEDEGILKPVYHVFYNAGMYLGSAAFDDSDGTASGMGELDKIAICHYYLGRNGTDGSYEYKVIEDEAGFGQPGYYISSSILLHNDGFLSLDDKEMGFALQFDDDGFSGIVKPDAASYDSAANLDVGPTASSAVAAPESNAVTEECEGGTDEGSEPSETVEETGADTSESAESVSDDEAGSNEPCGDGPESEDTGCIVSEMPVSEPVSEAA